MEQKDIETLRDLGLTPTEAKTYLALLQIGEGSVESIGKAADIARQHLYEALSGLERLSLVEKVLGKPLKYKALPPSDVFKILLERRNMKTKELEKTIASMNRKLDKKFVRQPSEDDHFTLISGENAFVREANEAVRRVATSFDGIVLPEAFRKGMSGAGKMHRDAVKRGVCYRHIVGKAESEFFKLGDEDLRNNPLWRVRISSRPLKIFMIILDGKTVFIANPSEMHYLKTDSPCMVEISQTYFNTLWQNSRELKQQVRG